MTEGIAPIETRYAGVLFRSRLEARWALFFNRLGLAWEYEPECFRLSNGVLYVPDFRFLLPRCLVHDLGKQAEPGPGLCFIDDDDLAKGYTGTASIYGEVKREGGDFSKARQLAEEWPVAMLEGMPPGRCTNARWWRTSQDRFDAAIRAARSARFGVHLAV